MAALTTVEADQQWLDVNWVTPTLAVGGCLSFDPVKASAQVRMLLNEGVTRIVDMREEGNDERAWKGQPVIYVHAPTRDAEGHRVPPEVFDTVVRAAAPRGSRAKTLVHCHMGVNRGPSAAYAVLLERQYDYLKAFDMVRKARPQAGLAYAVDALEAHQRRKGIFGSKTATLQRALLDEKVQAMWTDVQRRRTQQWINFRLAVDHVDSAILRVVR